MNKKTLSERDICTKFITPAIEKAGWDRNTQLLEEVSFTDGKIYVRGKLTARGTRKRADEEANAYKQFSPEFFDLIVIDECHRGSAKEDSAWREILRFFNKATHIGLTATPKETKEVSNIEYFGDPIYTYSLKQGIDDGFLAPYRVVRVNLNVDAEGWRPEQGKTDKETVLTPWRVVNMHLGDCLGGYSFLDDKREKTISQPHFVSQGKVTAEVFAPDSKILEINSKSGLYPLFIAYSIFRNRITEKYPDKEPNELTIEQQQKLWDKTVAENVFVLCKTPMAKSITKRTLLGFRDAKVNTHFFEDMVRQITQRPDKFIAKIRKGQSYWKANNNNDMKFNAIVGNPPYQEMDGGNSESARPVYHNFVEIAKQIEPEFFSMIMPARWYAGGKGLDSFRESMLADKRLSRIFDFPNSNDCFTNVDIAGGLCYFLWDSNHSDNCTITNNINGELISAKRPLNEFRILIRDNKAVPILKKVIMWNKEGKTLSDRVSSRKPFGLPTNYEPKDLGIPCWFIQRVGLKYADPNDIVDNHDYLGKWKFLVPPAPIAGQTDFTKPVGFYYDGNTRIAKPGECCTESFIIAGAFNSKNEVESFKSYLLTKVVRFLLLQQVVSQHVTKKVFGFIPDLGKYEGEFTDQKLCSLWGITKTEWEYIDSRINNINGN